MSLAELMEAIYCYIGYYKTERIHAALRPGVSILKSYPLDYAMSQLDREITRLRMVHDNRRG